MSNPINFVAGLFIILAGLLAFEFAMLSGVICFVGGILVGVLAFEAIVGGEEYKEWKEYQVLYLMGVFEVVSRHSGGSSLGSFLGNVRGSLVMHYNMCQRVSITYVQIDFVTDVT